MAKSWVFIWTAVVYPSLVLLRYFRIFISPILPAVYPNEGTFAIFAHCISGIFSCFILLAFRILRNLSKSNPRAALQSEV